MARETNKQETKAAAPSRTRRVLRTALNPEFGRSARSFSHSGQLFMQMLAMLFASAGILERDHKFLKQGSHIRLGDLFTETRARVDWRDRAQLPQTLFFAAVWGSLASAIVYAIVSVLLFAAAPSPAHATADPTGTVFTSSEPTSTSSSGGMFSVPDGDLANQFIRNLIKGEPIKAMQKDGETENAKSLTATGTIQTGLRAMLKFYSQFILIIASFMVLYHIIMLIVNSAWSGKPLEGANQIWGPLRLVLAIGLLVPLSDNLNSGQHIVLKIAEMSSGLATNGWRVFTTAITADVNLQQPELNAKVKREYANMVDVFTCAYSSNYAILNSGSVTEQQAQNMGDHYGALYVDNPDNFTPVNPNWIYVVKQSSTAGVSNYSVQNQTNQVNCGAIQIPQEQTDEQAAQTSKTLVDNTSIDRMANNVRNILAKSSKSLMDEARDTARMIVQQQMQREDKKDITLPAEEITASDITTKIKTDLINYYAGAQKAIKNGFTNGTGFDAVKNSSWIMAGAFFYQISAYQNKMYDTAQTSAQASYGSAFYGEPDSFQEDFSKNRDNYSAIVNTALNGQYAGNPKIPGTFLQGDPAITTENQTIGEQALDFLGSSVSAAFYGIKKGKLMDVFDNNVSSPYMATAHLGKLFLDNGLYVLLSGGILKAGGGIVKGLAKAAKGVVKGVVGNFAGDVLNGLGSLITAVATYMMILGVVLTVLIPLIPAIKFLLDAVSWLFAIFEAMLGMPLFALAHLTPGGNGLLDPARHGYVMLLHIAIRPILMVFGMLAAIILATIALFGLNIIFVPALNSVWGDGDTGLMMALIYFGAWTFSVYTIMNASFKFIDFLPNKTIQWLGGNGYQFDELERHVNPFAMQAAIRTVAGGVSGFANQLGGGAGGAVGEGVAKRIIDKREKPEKEAKEAKDRALLASAIAAGIAGRGSNDPDNSNNPPPSGDDGGNGSGGDVPGRGSGGSGRPGGSGGSFLPAGIAGAAGGIARGGLAGGTGIGLGKAAAVAGMSIGAAGIAAGAAGAYLTGGATGNRSAIAGGLNDMKVGSIAKPTSVPKTNADGTLGAGKAGDGSAIMPPKPTPPTPPKPAGFLERQALKGQTALKRAGFAAGVAKDAVGGAVGGAAGAVTGGVAAAGKGALDRTKQGLSNDAQNARQFAGKARDAVFGTNAFTLNNRDEKKAADQADAQIRRQMAATSDPAEFKALGAQLQKMKPQGNNLGANGQGGLVGRNGVLHSATGQLAAKIAAARSETGFGISRPTAPTTDAAFSSGVTPGYTQDGGNADAAGTMDGSIAPDAGGQDAGDQGMQGSDAQSSRPIDLELPAGTDPNVWQYHQYEEGDIGLVRKDADASADSVGEIGSDPAESTVAPEPAQPSSPFVTSTLGGAQTIGTGNMGGVFGGVTLSEPEAPDVALQRRQQEQTDSLARDMRQQQEQQRLQAGLLRSTQENKGTLAAKPDNEGTQSANTTNPKKSDSWPVRERDLADDLRTDAIEARKRQDRERAEREAVEREITEQKRKQQQQEMQRTHAEINRQSLEETLHTAREMRKDRNHDRGWDRER